MKLQENLNITNVVQAGMLEMIKNNAHSIREQEIQLSHFAQLSAKITWLSSYIQTRIYFATTKLSTILEEIIRHRVATQDFSERSLFKKLHLKFSIS